MTETSMHAVRGETSGELLLTRPFDPPKRGAEGEVLRSGRWAIKIRKHPFSEKAIAKTRVFMALGKRIPGFAWPKQFAVDPRTNAVVGEIQELVPGDDLQHLLNHKEPGVPLFPLVAKLRLAIQVAKAVAAAHAVRRPVIVLGDVIKAANLMVTGDSAQFVDASSASLLGFARSSQSASDQQVDAIETLRTPGYVPKEVLENPGLRPSHSRDLYSLAVLQFKILLGRAPTDCPTAIGLDPDEAVRKVIYPKYTSDLDHLPPTYDPHDLPSEVDDLFRAAFFTVAERPHAHRWVKVLSRWLRREQVVRLGAATRLARWGWKRVRRIPAQAIVPAVIFVVTLVAAYMAAPNPVHDPARQLAEPGMTDVQISADETPTPTPGPVVGPKFFQEFFK